MPKIYSPSQSQSVRNDIVISSISYVSIGPLKLYFPYDRWYSLLLFVRSLKVISNVLRSLLLRITLLMSEIDFAAHTSARRDISLSDQLQIIFHINTVYYVLILMWCSKVTYAYNCNPRSRNRFHASKLIRNDISHLIIGLFFFSKWPLQEYIPDFHPFQPKAIWDSRRLLGERYMAHYGYIKYMFCSDAQIFTSNPLKTSPCVYFS